VEKNANHEGGISHRHYAGQDSESTYAGIFKCNVPVIVNSFLPPA
jgi:hypothetical protein